MTDPTGNDATNERAKPTPARALGEATAPAPEPEAIEPEVEIEVEGVPWTVRVVGRAVGGRNTNGTPLLMLGFARAGSEPSSRRELLTVGRSLDSFSVDELREAFDRATPPPDPERRPSFFPDPRERRRS